MLGAVILPLATRHVLRRRLTAGVAVLGLACGVAAIAASQVLYAAVVSTYETTTLGFAGRAALQVTNGDSGVAEELADEVRRVPGVQAVVASVEGFVATPDLPGERLYLYGVDLLADQQVRDYGAGTDAVVSDPMTFLAASDSVALTSQFMRAHALAMHDRLRVLTPAGTVELTIRAALGTQRGPATVLDGRLAVVDLSVAQELLRLDGRVSELAITVAPGADLTAVERAVVARVGLRGTVEPPRSRAAAFGRLLGNYRNGLTLAATVAMLVAVYFVFNLATIAVEDRRREIALLRLVGMSASSVTTLVFGEILLVALVATALGLPLGFALARLLSSASGAGVAALYADIGDPSLRCDGGAMLWSIVVGVVTPLGAAVGPLRRTLGIRPLEAMRTNLDVGEIPPAGLHGLLVGAAAIAGAVVVWIGRAHLPFAAERTATITMLLVAVGTALSLPGLLQVLATGSDRGIGRLGRILALLAARNVARDMRRLTVTCAAVLVSLAGTIAIATWISSLDGTLADAFETVFGRIDLVVSGGADPFAQEAIRIPTAVADELAGWPEVAFVDPVRVSTIALAGSRAAVVASDARLYRNGRRNLSMVDGDVADAAAALASGIFVVVNQVFARRFGRRAGDVLELATPEGPLRVRIAGIHLELTPGDLGTIRLDRALYRRWWRDETASVIEVSLRPDADRRRVADAIRARWGAQHHLVVLTTDELRRVYGDLLRRLTGLVYPLLAVALGCALVGVVSSGVATALARRRVVAILRAVGCTRRQVATVFGLESALVGAIAATTAALAGAGLGWLQVEVLLRGTLGMSVLYAYPLRLAAIGVSAVMIVTSLCGWFVGARAGRVAIESALQAD
jgi:putative ABC transport system permease protein